MHQRSMKNKTMVFYDPIFLQGWIRNILGEHILGEQFI